jgi:hypothetical protein
MAIGYDVRPVAKAFEIMGVPDEVLLQFSKRTAKIKETAAKLGITDPKILDKLGALTRKAKKSDLTFSELRQLWRAEVSAAHRVTMDRFLRPRPSSHLGQHPLMTPEVTFEPPPLGIHLIHKAGVRLRRLGYWASMLAVSVEFKEGGWNAQGSLGHCQDTQTMIEVFDRLWRTRTAGKPVIVSMVLFKLMPAQAMTLPLFPEDRLRERLAKAMDSINARFGQNTVYFAEIHKVRQSAPTRISFTQIPDFSVE